jgi:hypothetical protein
MHFSLIDKVSGHTWVQPARKKMQNWYISDLFIPVAPVNLDRGTCMHLLTHNYYTIHTLVNSFVGCLKDVWGNNLALPAAL